MSSTTSEPLLSLLSPHLPNDLQSDNEFTTTYLNRLAALPLESITAAESTDLASASTNITTSLQSLSARSHKALINSSNHLSALPDHTKTFNTAITALSTPSTGTLHTLDSTVSSFTTTYSPDSPALQHRQTTLTLQTQVPTLLDILSLPTLLATSLSQPPLALDLLSHARRLHQTFPTSPLINSIHTECEAHRSTLVTSLLSTLRSGLKLPTAIKTVGYLRRANPDLAQPGAMEALFLVCRLHWILNLFGALGALREAADEEYYARKQGKRVGGQQTERYLKRWIEVFREQSFATVSMFKSIFSDPEELAGEAERKAEEERRSPLPGFILHLIKLLEETLERYLPSVTEPTGRQGLLMQIQYASGSLGRLGSDFALGLAKEEGGEWVEVVEKQREAVGRFEDAA
ncbi:hypothetical protein BJ508DRAFT_362099 [Ascobolus immersus RN42]|uniref:Conserved oligomeric Golgi complex subunit 8 n=1 Tax=Ascobolus immersus RN42 TaxID=1160509 RepID=A0A3N4IA66_ASCIM|nr:hypothetical protein BJ508DRAFT_362099 [Ascobolus immersus RN42]